MAKRAFPTSAGGEVPAASQLATVLPFTFEGNEVRVVDRDGGLWFFLADACKVLGIKNPSDAASRLDDDEKSTLGKTEGGKINGLGSIGAMPTLISEPGFYKLIGRSNKPVAKRFDRWVRHEVLPTIWRTGSYTAPGAAPAALDLDNPASVLALAGQLSAKLAETQSSVQTLEAQASDAAPKLAAWDRLVNADGLLPISLVAKATGIQQKRIFEFIEHTVHWCFRRNFRDGKKSALIAGADAIRGGHVASKLHEFTRSDGTTGGSTQVYLTIKGAKRLAELLVKYGLIRPSETTEEGGG